MFRELFFFNCKINLRNIVFLLAAAASIIFSVISQLPYFEHYRLTDPSDMQQISDRMQIDSTVPTNSEEQIQLTVEAIQSILSDVLKLQNTSDIITDLRELLSVKTNWSIKELDELWAELVSEYSELKMLMPNHLSNSFINNSRRSVTREELYRYAYSERTFSDYLSVEFGQSLSLVISVLFIIFFSTIFLGDVKPGMSDVLHINVISSQKMIYAKYISAIALVTACVCLDIVGVNIMQLLYIKDLTIEQLLVVWGNVLLYCIPTVVFLSSVSALLCILFKNAIMGIAVLLLSNFISSCAYVLPNGSRRQLFIAPFVANLNSFFDPISNEDIIAIILNRIAFCLMGTAVLKLTAAAWENQKSTGVIRRSFKPRILDKSLISPKSFFFYNAKIILNKVKLAALLVIFSVPYISINANTDILNVSRSILLMTGWASVILFANIESVEYSDNTIDLYKLSAKDGKAVCIRYLICVAVVMLFAAGVFFLSLLRINPLTYNFEYVMDIFIRMMISCVTCSCFLGSVAMTVGYAFKRTWFGISVGLIANILLSPIKSASMFCLYMFYYFPGNENGWPWMLSIAFYASAALVILICNIYFSVRSFRNQ